MSPNSNMPHLTLRCITFLTTVFILCFLHQATGLKCYHSDVINTTRIVTAECDAAVKSCLNITTQDVRNPSRGTPNYTCGSSYSVPLGCHSNTSNNTTITVCSCAVSLCNGVVQERPEGEPDVGRTKGREARTEPDVSPPMTLHAGTEPDVRRTSTPQVRSEPDVGQTSTPQDRSEPDVRLTNERQARRNLDGVSRPDKHPAKISSQCYEGRLILPKTLLYFGQAEYAALLTTQTSQVSCIAPKMCMRSVSDFPTDKEHHLVFGCEENKLPVAEKPGCHIERIYKVRTQSCFCFGDECNDNLAGLPADDEEWARNMATVLPWTRDFEPSVFTDLKCYACDDVKEGENKQCGVETCKEGVKMCTRVKRQGVTEWGCAKEDKSKTVVGCRESVVEGDTVETCYCDTMLCNDDTPAFAIDTVDSKSVGDVLAMCWELVTVSLVFLLVLL